jgi:hypothetical protein
VVANGSPCPDTLNYNTTAFTWNFQYNDLTTGTGWVNAYVFTPSGAYTSIKSYITYGTTASAVNEAYWVQVGAIFTPYVPPSSDWDLLLTNTEYTLSGSTSETMLDHAVTLPWFPFSLGLGVFISYYETYWMELWGISQNPAQCTQGILPTNGTQVNITGSGSTSSNSISVEYANSNIFACQAGGSTLW